MTCVKGYESGRINDRDEYDKVNFAGSALSKYRNMFTPEMIMVCDKSKEDDGTECNCVVAKDKRLLKTVLCMRKD